MQRKDRSVSGSSEDGSVMLETVWNVGQETNKLVTQVIDAFVRELKIYVHVRMYNRNFIMKSYGKLIDFNERLDEKLQEALDKINKNIKHSPRGKITLASKSKMRSIDFDSFDLSSLIYLMKDYYLDCFGKNSLTLMCMFRC